MATEEKEKDAEEKKEPEAVVSQPEEKEEPVDERYEQILAANEELRNRVDQMEAKTKQPSSNNWDAISDRDLEYIASHPTEYPQHAQLALSEMRKRDRETIKSQMSNEISTKTFMSQHKEAFDASTPLGKEVQRIIGKNRLEADVLADVIELAKFRIGGGKEGKEARQKVVNAMKAADAHSPGSDNVSQPAAPSFMDMPKEEFEDKLQSIKLKTFNRP